MITSSFNLVEFKIAILRGSRPVMLTGTSHSDIIPPILRRAAGLCSAQLAVWLDVADLRRVAGNRRRYNKGTSEVGPC